MNHEAAKMTDCRAARSSDDQRHAIHPALATNSADHGAASPGQILK
jgi:hypothetical protein